MECAICLQTCVHPVKLPCSHIFCFLCVKGVANQSKRCAMCRQEIPVDYIDNPCLLSKDELNKHCAFEDGYQWFYEGRNGWWLYDERTSAELEQAYKHGDNECELLIAGFLYVIDYSNMVQMRRNDPSRRRRIKRDLASIPTKGIAGLRIANDNCSSQTSVDSQGREGAYGQEHSTQASSSDNAQIVSSVTSSAAGTSDTTDSDINSDFQPILPEPSCDVPSQHRDATYIQNITNELSTDDYNCINIPSNFIGSSSNGAVRDAMHLLSSNNYSLELDHEDLESSLSTSFSDNQDIMTLSASDEMLSVHSRNTTRLTPPYLIRTSYSVEDMRHEIDSYNTDASIASSYSDGEIHRINTSNHDSINWNADPIVCDYESEETEL